MIRLDLPLNCLCSMHFWYTVNMRAWCFEELFSAFGGWVQWTTSMHFAAWVSWPLFAIKLHPLQNIYEINAIIFGYKFPTFCDASWVCYLLSDKSIVLPEVWDQRWASEIGLGGHSHALGFVKVVKFDMKTGSDCFRNTWVDTIFYTFCTLCSIRIRLGIAWKCHI